MRPKRNLRAAQQRLDRLPVSFPAIHAAYVRFLDDGKLPTDDVLAGAVLHRALHARRPVPEHQAEIREMGLHQPFGTTREMLFREALSSDQALRGFARFLLHVAAQAGYDLTDPELIGPEMEPSEFGYVSMRLLGWPQDYVRPEYQRQMERVLRQQAAVDAGQHWEDVQWQRGAGSALAAFLKRGALPTDVRYLSFVLTAGETFALNGHFFGQGGEDLIAAYEAVATSTGKKREVALRQLCALQARSELGA